MLSGITWHVCVDLRYRLSCYFALVHGVNQLFKRAVYFCARCVIFCLFFGGGWGRGGGSRVPQVRYFDDILLNSV